MGLISTGFRKEILGGGKSVREICKDMVLKLYTGAIPASADAVITGTLVATVTTAGAVAKVAQVVTITPTTAGTTGTWTVVLNGITFTYTDDGSPTANEVATGLFRLINTGQGASGKSFTTVTDGAISAGGRITIPSIYQLFTVADATGSITITAAAGVSFEYSSTATGAGNSLNAVLTTDSRYGLRFEAYGDIASGILEKLSTDAWSGAAVAVGNPITYGRFVQDSDTGVLSTSEVRLQGLVAQANSEIIVTHVDVAIGEIVNVTAANIFMRAGS